MNTMLGYVSMNTRLLERESISVIAMLGGNMYL